MKHPIDFSLPAHLIRADRVVNMGEGYRQISGPTVAEGNAMDLVRQARQMPPREQGKMFITNVDGVPQSLDEIEAQLREGK